MRHDGRFIEYGWGSREEFISDMESDNETIPMLDDPVVTADIDVKSFNEKDLSDLGITNVKDFLSYMMKSVKTPA